MEQKKLYVTPEVNEYEMKVQQMLCESGTGGGTDFARPMDFTDTEELN